MKWEPQQSRAIDEVGRWIKSRDHPFFTLGGYAGTGKTTLAKYLAQLVGSGVFFAAYTGKAAHVLLKSGAENVSTVHRLIYSPKDKSQLRLRTLEAERAKLMTHKPLPETLIKKVEAAILIEKQNLSRPAFQLNSASPLIGASLLILDEYSMIDEQMGNDIMSFGVPVLALGDPGQLKPVRGRPFFGDKPRVMLTDIRRQALDNPIIWMSREVREGRELKPGSYGESSVVLRSKIDGDDLRARILGADQLLVGRNETRKSSNHRIRELLGRTGWAPEDGDKLICLRNNHETGLLNGQIWENQGKALYDGQYVIMNLVGEEKQKLEVFSHADYFRGGEPEFYNKKDAEEFDYGYAMTVHKAQGSQFDYTVLFDEWRGSDRKEWFYTGITRAAEKVDVVRM